MVTKCYSGKQKALKSENSGVFILYKTGLTLRRHLPSAPSQSEVGQEGAASVIMMWSCSDGASQSSAEG